ncbi:hypothetical protein GCM10011341_11580 [Frigidibacter albus]|nr:hypothetical protein GCM10011341_11580 [Frigidibacter albus]
MHPLLDWLVPATFRTSGGTGTINRLVKNEVKTRGPAICRILRQSAAPSGKPRRTARSFGSGGTRRPRAYAMTRTGAPL